MGLDAQSNDPPAASSEEKSDVLSDTRAEAPDWDALTIELRCPRCGYDVRRLPQPRCPECGLQFSWGELIAAVEQRLSSPLFEYQWRYRPVRSFFGTLGRALLPWMLWRNTTMVLEPRLGPLLAFLLLVLALYVSVCVSADAALDWVYADSIIGLRFQLRIQERISAVSAPALGALALLLLTGVALQIFQQTINRYRIRRCHFARILLLAATGLLMWRAVLFVLFQLLVVLAMRASPWLRPALGWLVYVFRLRWLILVLPIVMFALAVAIGLSGYLRVRRGWAMAITSVFVVLLALVTPVPALTVYFGQADNIWVRTLGTLWPGLENLIWYVLAY